MTNLFGELRSLLASAQPSADLFARTCNLLGSEPTPAPALEYVHHHLERWPQDIERRMPWTWRERLADGQTCPQAGLCDTLTWTRAPEEPAVEPTRLERLLAAPELHNLRRLDLGRARIGPRGSVSIAESQNLSTLEVMSLDSTSALARGIEALVASPNLPSWRTLYVSAEGSLVRTHERMQGRPSVHVERYGPSAASRTWQIETLLRPDAPQLLESLHVRALARYGGAMAAFEPGWHAAYFEPRIAERLGRLGERGALVKLDLEEMGAPERWRGYDAETLMFRVLELSESLPHASDLRWILEHAVTEDERETLVVTRFGAMIAERPLTAFQRRRLERLMPLLELERAKRLFEAWGLEGEALAQRLELHLSTD